MSKQGHSRAQPLALATILVVFTLATVPAKAAGDGSDSITSRISIAGLNLANPADQAKLRHRIAIAANQVCQQAIYDQAIDGIGFANCYSQVRKRAWAQAEVAIAAAQTPIKTASQTP